MTIALCCCATAFGGDQRGIDWKPWSDSVFAQARNEHRFVLLDLGTVWCHRCHVMDEVTYGNAGVIELVRKRYIAVRVDADSRPDLSNRYEDYGWPATRKGTRSTQREGSKKPMGLARWSPWMDRPVKKEGVVLPMGKIYVARESFARLFPGEDR